MFLSGRVWMKTSLPVFVDTCLYLSTYDDKFSLETLSPVVIRRVWRQLYIGCIVFCRHWARITSTSHRLHCVLSSLSPYDDNFTLATSIPVVIGSLGRLVHLVVTIRSPQYVLPQDKSTCFTLTNTHQYTYFNPKAIFEERYFRTDCGFIASHSASY